MLGVKSSFPFFIGLGLIILFVVVAVLYQNASSTATETYQPSPPAEVVRQYFVSWNEKRYPDMYATLSDGFKKIDPNAKDLATFRQFASSQGIEKVKIIGITEKSNDGQTATVDYSVEFMLGSGSTQPFQGTYTLKYRQSDVILGWKLIHPYGKNIDTS